MRSLLDRAAVDGAKLLTGDAADGVIMQPCVLGGVTPAMDIFHAENFSPAVSITRARDEDHGVAPANDPEHGLSAAMFACNIARGLQVARKIRSGICHVNGPTVHDEAQMPFGGMKASGYGRFGGKAGIDAFTELRWLTVETEHAGYRST